MQRFPFINNSNFGFVLVYGNDTHVQSGFRGIASSKKRKIKERKKKEKNEINFKVLASIDSDLN